MGPRTSSTCHVCGREYTSITVHRSNDLQVEATTCDICSATQSESADNTCILEQSDENQKIERPQTKTLKKPTPNLSHPVIEDVENNTEPQPIKKNRENTKISKSYTHYRDRKARNKPVPNSHKEKTETGDKRIVPSPCNSCSRHVAPERLHSHVPTVNGSRFLTKAAERNSNMPKKNGAEITKNEQKEKQNDNSAIVTDTGGSKGPRALICYICGRPFGSKSLSLHEPHCLERWKRENELLPAGQRRSVPQKPDTTVSMTRDEFNEASWNSFQANLVPCPNCGRTFFPERLIVHQRVCKETANNRNNKSIVSNEPIPPMSPINDNDIQLVQQEGSRVTAARIPLGTCYICGRLFGSKSIYIHEPQCLKKWRAENDQLPPHMKRPEPEKPALVLNADGTLDVDTMIEAAWQSHLQQLVPCPHCERTFYPDRLMVHERSCKRK